MTKEETTQNEERAQTARQALASLVSPDALAVSAVADAMRRSEGAGRADKEAGTFGVTASDAKKLASISYPVPVRGRAITWDEEEGCLVARDLEEYEEQLREAGRRMPSRGPARVGINWASEADLLVYVGVGEWPTAEAFVASAAEATGWVQRVPRVPQHVTPGKTRVFAAHDNGVEGVMGIVGYGILREIRAYVMEGAEPDYPDHVEVVEVKGDDDRCDTQELVVEEFLDFDPPRDYQTLVNPQGTRFRGYQRVLGGAILDAPGATISLQESSDPEALLDITWPQPEFDEHGRAPWTEEEWEVLRSLVERLGSQQEAFRVYSRHTGRGFHAVAHKWHREARGE